MKGSNTKLTTQEFIERAQCVHGNKFDYSKVIYNGMNIDVQISCPIHGSYMQRPLVHLTSVGCPKCGAIQRANKKKKTTKDFIQEAKNVHGDKYDYSKVEYKLTTEEVCIICPTHGEFWQMPYVHLQGHGCNQCAREYVKEKIRDTKEDFIKKAKKIFGDKFSYEKVIYADSYTKVCIICPEHGEFWQRPYSHLNGNGCIKCFNEFKRGKARKISLEKFIRESQLVHNNKYDYSLINKDNYIDTHHVVPIKCPFHGIFSQTPKLHKKGSGCPHCPPSVISLGEKKINDILSKVHILFIPQYKVANNNLLCANKHFFVDFYIPSKNVFIEYNGEQHYKPSGYWGGKEKLKKTQERDEALRFYCHEHKIRLIEIPYWEKENIEEILKKELNIK